MLYTSQQWSIKLFFFQTRMMTTPGQPVPTPAAIPPVDRDKIYQWIIQLTSPDTRENALQELR